MSRNRYDEGALAFRVACAKPVTYTRADLTSLNYKERVRRCRTPTSFLPRITRGRMKEGDLPTLEVLRG